MGVDRVGKSDVRAMPTTVGSISDSLSTGGPCEEEEEEEALSSRYMWLGSANGISWDGGGGLKLGLEKDRTDSAPDKLLECRTLGSLSSPSMVETPRSSSALWSMSRVWPGRPELMRELMPAAAAAVATATREALAGLSNCLRAASRCWCMSSWSVSSM